jgi:hypothetical protein
MFVCLECEHVFEVPKKYTETHGLDHGPFEVFYACPKCGGTYAKTMLCDCCHKWIKGDYITVDDGNIYCENCCCHRCLGEE